MAYPKHGRGRVALALVTLLATVGLLPASKAASARPPKVHTVVMNKMVYGPAPSGVRAGDVILWVNKDIFRHTATARDKSFNVDLPAGKSARTVVQKPGVISYFCRYHPGMKGQLAVGK